MYPGPEQPARTVGKRILMRMFGRPTGLLGRLGGIIMARTNQKVAAWAIDLLGVNPSDRVLEVGFGPGVGIQRLAKSASSGRVVGVDCSTEMVEQATARNAKAIEAGRVELREGSVERLPFEDETFNRALVVNSMQVWPDVVGGLREIRRVMKPGDFFGEISMIDRGPGTATVTTLTPSRLFVMSHVQFRDAIKASDPLMVKVLMAMGQRLREDAASRS